MTCERQDEYNAIHSYFIGPKGSNLPDFRANINTILDELLEARQNYYPQDQKFISKEVRRSEKFEKVRNNLSLATRTVAQLLGEHSAPFWSPRYEAHMCTDLTMSSLLGYFMTMLYNPNNVALEASPLTTLVELRVGKQLCKLFGYKIDERKSPFTTNPPPPPVGWGHITCDGTIANLESIWVARNLKFYPLTLHEAVTGAKGKLKFIADDFKVKPCKKSEGEKLFKDMSTWELLNLRPETVLDLPTKLQEQYGITSEFLEEALREDNIQTIGRGELEKRHKIEEPMKYFVSKTRHYSWPKGAAIAGLGSGNMVGVDVDLSARVDLGLLEKKLKDCVRDEVGVYAVVAVIGSTEEGAVDRLSKIVKMRQRFQDEHGLSFLIHADAAWGGYFATMLSRNEPHHHATTAKGHDSCGHKPEPEMYLDPDTREDLTALEEADSITVDPHKAGYIPYPAGSLVYKDGRMRYLVTWSGPYLSQGSAENIGVYGVEGSKPGAAAMSAWFSNQTIGLHSCGYGTLLGEATFTSARLSAHYATMITNDFICVPFNMLASEKEGRVSYLSKDVQKERELINKLIIGKEDSAIFKSKEAMEIICRLGSDTNINAFALNWKHADGTLNTDLEEANYFMKNIVDRLSITTADTDPTTIPIFLTSTKFSHDDYGVCAEKFKERMGLTPNTQSLFVLRNVVMSPFPTQMNFIGNLMKDFEEEIKKEVEVCRKRNTPGKYNVQFLVQGNPENPKVFLVFQTSFHSATRRQQIILSATLDNTLQSSYKELRSGGHEGAAILESLVPKDIEQLMKDLVKGHVKIKATVHEPTSGDSTEHSKSGIVTLESIIKSRPLNSINRDDTYPTEFMPFYLYGDKDNKHISHMLVHAPNIDLSASNLSFSPELPQVALELLPEGLILGFSRISEEALQPFPLENKKLSDPFFFRKDNKFAVKVWKDPHKAEAKGPGLLKGLGEQEPLYTGEVTLGRDVVVDAEGPNTDPFADKKPIEDSWQSQLDRIGNMLNGVAGANANGNGNGNGYC